MVFTVGDESSILRSHYRVNSQTTGRTQEWFGVAQNFTKSDSVNTVCQVLLSSMRFDRDGTAKTSIVGLTSIYPSTCNHKTLFQFSYPTIRHQPSFPEALQDDT
jgi:hypothetical protein